MTQRAGLFLSDGPVNYYFFGPHSQRAGFLIESTSAVPNLLKFKNQGWYAPGSSYETWVSVTAPNTFPPSGHTLSDISYVVFQDTAA